MNMKNKEQILIVKNNLTFLRTYFIRNLENDINKYAFKSLKESPFNAMMQKANRIYKKLKGS